MPVDQKQVWQRTVDGPYIEDIIALRREPALPGAVPLLQCVMHAGQASSPVPTLAEPSRRLEGKVVCPVRMHEALAT